MTAPELVAGSRSLGAISILLTDCDAGHYTLPPELVEAGREALGMAAAIEERSAATASSFHDARAVFAAEVRSAVRAGEPMPSARALLEARVANEVEPEIASILSDLERQTRLETAKVFRDMQASILTAHLRPAFVETIAKAKKAKRADLPTLRARYAAIRRARSQLTAIPAARRDVHGVFSEFKNLPDVWPEFYPERSRESAGLSVLRSPAEINSRDRSKAAMMKRSPERFTGTAAPWPIEINERFAWQLARLDFWLPTGGEQDARFDAYLAEMRTTTGPSDSTWKKLDLPKRAVRT